MVARDSSLWRSGGRPPALLPVLLLFLLGPPTSDADPYAATVSQVEWNEQTGRLEVALRAAPEAVERALSIYFGTDIRLNADDDSKLERRLLRYLRDTFVVDIVAPSERADEEHEAPRAPIEWVGFELESHRLVWLYFEMPLESLERARLSVRLFYEIEPRQLHVVRLRTDAGQQAWTLTPEHPSIRLAPPTTSEN